MAQGVVLAPLLSVAHPEVNDSKFGVELDHIVTRRAWVYDVCIDMFFYH